MGWDEPTFPATGPPAAPPVIDTPAGRDALSCPLCGYSLRGLAHAEAPQCPECGYQFAWPELLRARQNRHRYLFEHHPGRNLWSLIGTLGGGLVPRRFWSSLNGGHEIRAKRLLLYWAIVAAVILLSGFGGTFVANGIKLYRVNLALTQMGVVGASAPLPPAPDFFRIVLLYSVDENNLEAYLLVAALAWPWLTLASLMVFQASMRRARVRPGHVLRCVIYAGDVFIWWGLLLVLRALADWISMTRDYWDDTQAVQQTTGAFLFMAIPAVYRLGVAYRRYLRFDRPWLTVLASQVVVFLIYVTVLSAFYSDFWRLMPSQFLSGQP